MHGICTRGNIRVFCELRTYRTLVLSKVLVERKWRNLLTIILIFQSVGMVLCESQCGCATRMHQYVHCKHIVVLIACAEFSIYGTLLLEETCRQKLQYFHHTKIFTGSPLKSNRINMPGENEMTNSDSYDPRSEHFETYTKLQFNFFKTFASIFMEYTSCPSFNL